MNLDVVQEARILWKCKKCKAIFVVEDDNITWDEKGLGYSTKLCKCSECNTLNVMEYYEDCSLDLNKDARYYQY